MSINRRAVIVAIPLVIVNTVSVIAQFEFIRAHLPTWNVTGQVLLAIAVESLALTMAYFYFEAVTAGDSAFALKLASLGYGFLIGGVNASHYMQDGKVTAAAVMVGLLSASSPILWNTYTKRQSRDKLLSKGLISPHAVRLGMTRILWHPIKSAQVFSMATWNVNPELGPREIIETWEASREARPVRRAKHVANGSGPVCGCGCGETLPSGSTRNYKRGHRPDIAPVVPNGKATGNPDEIYPPIGAGYPK